VDKTRDKIIKELFESECETDGADYLKAEDVADFILAREAKLIADMREPLEMYKRREADYEYATLECCLSGAEEAIDKALAVIKEGEE